MKPWLLLVGVIGGVSGLPALAVDRNGNGESDVWEMLYGAGALSPAGDADGDGFSNGAEAQAGTNPFDGNSVPRLRLELALPLELQFTWDSSPGKRYTIQSRNSLAGGGWSSIRWRTQTTWRERKRSR